MTSQSKRPTSDRVGQLLVENKLKDQRLREEKVRGRDHFETGKRGSLECGGKRSIQECN